MFLRWDVPFRCNVCAGGSANVFPSDMDLDTTNWSGEGAFTQVLIEAFQELSSIAGVRVEDASSARSDAEYNFVSNEVFVRFRTRDQTVRAKMLGIIPVIRTVSEAVMKLPDLERTLGDIAEVGPPDYADEGMLQYLRTERVVPPYQTRGYKLVELVRVYEVGTAPRAPEGS